MTRIFLLLAVIFVSFTATGTTAPQSNRNCPSNNLQLALNNGITGGNSVINGIVQKPDTSFISKCLGSLSMPSFGLDFGLPNVMQAMQNVCQMAVRQIKQSAPSMQNVAGMPLNFSGGTMQATPPSIANAFNNGFGSGVNIPTTTTTISTNSAPPAPVSGAMNYLLPQLNQ